MMCYILVSLINLFIYNFGYFLSIIFALIDNINIHVPITCIVHDLGALEVP